MTIYTLNKIMTMNKELNKIIEDLNKKENIANLTVIDADQANLIEEEKTFIKCTSLKK
jgi:hypothetical protein